MPRLVGTKHIKHRILRVGNGAFFCSLKYISSTLRFAPEGLFFCRRAVWSGGFFHFTFPWPGGCGSSRKTQKRSQTWPKEIRIPASAKPPSPELGTTPSPRARVRVRVVCHTGILKESLTVLPGARARVREESTDFTAWRVKTFGGNFDPVREAVEDAVAEFSDRQAARDRSLWLKIANEIGYEAFRDLYLEQISIMRECKLRNPSAAFQCMVGS